MSKQQQQEMKKRVSYQDISWQYDIAMRYLANTKKMCHTLGKLSEASLKEYTQFKSSFIPFHFILSAILMFLPRWFYYRFRRYMLIPLCGIHLRRQPRSSIHAIFSSLPQHTQNCPHPAELHDIQNTQ